MSKENEKELRKPVDEKLSDEALEQVTGGQIELVEDDSTNALRGATNRGLNTDPLSRGDYIA